jgi:hypothetical protein
LQHTLLERAKQENMVFSDCCKQIKLLRSICTVVPQSPLPPVLIHGLQGGSRLRNGHAKTKSEHNFGIGKMIHDLNE